VLSSSSPPPPLLFLNISVIFTYKVRHEKVFYIKKSHRNDIYIIPFKLCFCNLNLQPMVPGHLNTIWV
jgi:hypothetical protein